MMLFSLFLGKGVQSQINSDSLLELNVLGPDDLAEQKRIKKDVVFGPNRVPENSDELAQLTYVITRDEILRNGYSSLNDVLKNIPGMRTSDPGSALMGESFLMRGLLGNSYTKILINGISFTPSNLPGFPLAANLPIKQAERIEITFGPVTTVYGNDAMAGVINIVMSEVDKPIEVIANTALGMSANLGQNDENTGANELHILLGGQTGKGKNILQYQFFGSSKRMKDRNLLAPDSLLRLDSSIAIGEIRFVPAGPVDTLLPKVEDFGHDSRLLGIQLDFRGFRLSASSMARSEHSSIGGHPLEYAYHQPLSKVRDQINSIRLQYNATPGNFWLQSNIGFTNYSLDENSSYEGIEHPIADGINFMYGLSNDLQIEQLVNYQKNNLSLLFGANMVVKSGNALLQFLSRPFSDQDLFEDARGNLVVNSSRDDGDEGDLVAPFIPFNTYNSTDIGTFAQVSYRGKMFDRDNFFKINAGLRGDFNDLEELELSPKADIFLNLSDKFKVRGLFATGFRRASPYYEYSNYEFSLEPGEDDPTLKLIPKKLSEETLLNIEGGFTWTPFKGATLSFHTFFQQLENSLFLSLRFPDNNQDTTEVFEMGFSNENSISRLSGTQLTFTYNRVKERLVDDEIVRSGLIFLASGQYYIGREAIENIDTISSFRGVPDIMAQAQITYLQASGWRFTALGSYTGGFISTITNINREIRRNFSGNGFFNLDLIIGRSLGRLDAYLRFENITSTIGKGISHDFISETRLAYTPMKGRFATLGLTFKID